MVLPLYKNMEVRVYISRGIYLVYLMNKFETFSFLSTAINLFFFKMKIIYFVCWLQFEFKPPYTVFVQTKKSPS